MNTVTITFIECDPPPAQGYNLKWRVAGSEDAYTDEGNFSSSPIIFIDNLNPQGTCYEGTLQSICTESGESGELVGQLIPWTSECEESGVESEYAYFNADEYACDECFVPVRTVVVRILRTELPIIVPKFYWPDPLEPFTTSYQVYGPELPAQASILLSGINTVLCKPC